MTGIVRLKSWLAVIILSAGSAFGELSYQCDWFGNSFGVGGSEWVQHDVFDIFVRADGTVYTNSRWDEGKKEAGIYKDGQCAGKLADTHANLGGFAIAGNSTHIFLGMKNGNLRKYKYDGATAGSLVKVTTDANGPMGLAATDSLVFMSDAAANQIKVLSAATLAEIRSFPFANPGKLVLGPDGTLWVAKTENAPDDPAVYNMSIDGNALGKKISLGGIGDLTFDKDGFLWIADNGSDQQVKKYTVSGDGQPHLVETLGQKGGILAGTPGQVAPLKFNGITGVGVDDAGTIYVACDGLAKSPWGWKGTELRAFSKDKELLWELYGLEWVDGAAADPDDHTQVYTQQERFEIDWSKNGGAGWTYKAYTIDPVKYPHDKRISKFLACTQVIRVNGHKLMYLSDMTGSQHGIYRFDGEIAVPAGMFNYAGTSGILPNAPNVNRWFWVDKNGNGSCETEEFEKHPWSTARGGCAGTVDSKGNVWYLAWNGQIECWKLTGFSDAGVPLYSSDAVDTARCPARIDRFERIFYDADRDEMWIAGNVPELPDPQQPQGSWFMPAGHAIIRIDNWSKGNREVSLEVPISYGEKTGDEKMVAKSFALAGDYLFVSHFVKTIIKVHDRKTGALVGVMPPKDPIGTNSGDHDIPYAITAIKRDDGEYVVFAEDDRFQKIVMYRWCPDACSATKAHRPHAHLRSLTSLFTAGARVVNIYTLHGALVLSVTSQPPGIGHLFERLRDGMYLAKAAGSRNGVPLIIAK